MTQNDPRRKTRKETEGQHFRYEHFYAHLHTEAFAVYVYVSLASLSIPRFVYLLQCGVGDAIAGQAEVRHGQVELFEEQSKGPISGPTIRQDVGDLLTDALQEGRLRDVAPQKLTHSCQICWTRR